MTLPAFDYLPAGWEILVLLNAAAVASLMPLVAYRAWRWWHRRSSLAAGAMAVTVSVLWLSLALAWCWDALPPVAQAVEISGGPGVLLVSAIQVIVISLRGTSRHRLRREIWSVIAAALCVLVIMTIAVVVGDATSVNLRQYRFNLSPDMTNTGLIVATVTANVYMAAVLVQMIWIGVRRVDNTPTGWGVGLIAAGAAGSLVQVVHGGILNHIGLVIAPENVWLNVVPSVVCGVCLLAGLTAPPLILHLQATRKLGQLQPIRNRLIYEFPNLDTPLAAGASRADLVHEWCSQIQDGLTLTGQLRGTPLEGDWPSAELTPRAQAVARWLASDKEPNLNFQWLVTPDAVSGKNWTLAVATAYRRHALGAGLLGRPSMLRRWLTMSAMTWRVPSDRP